jgi:hypothetical protein
MAITLSSASRTAACDAVVDKIDQGSGAGKLKLKSAGDVVLCIITLNDPAFDAAATGAAALDVSPALSGTGEAAAAGGTDATKFDFTDSDDTVIFSGVVGEGSGEISLNNSNIASGQTVSITGYTHTQPA